MSAGESFSSVTLRNGILHDQLNALVWRKIANDLGKYPGYGLELARPVGLMMWPCQPGCRVWLPLRGHKKTRRGLLHYFPSNMRLVMPP